MRHKDYNGFTPDELNDDSPAARLLDVMTTTQELVFQLGEALGVTRDELTCKAIEQVTA